MSDIAVRMQNMWRKNFNKYSFPMNQISVITVNTYSCNLVKGFVSSYRISCGFLLVPAFTKCAICNQKRGDFKTVLIFVRHVDFFLKIFLLNFVDKRGKEDNAFQWLISCLSSVICRFSYDFSDDIRLAKQSIIGVICQQSFQS